MNHLSRKLLALCIGGAAMMAALPVAGTAAQDAPPPAAGGPETPKPDAPKGDTPKPDVPKDDGAADAATGEARTVTGRMWNYSESRNARAKDNEDGAWTSETAQVVVFLPLPADARSPASWGGLEVVKAVCDAGGDHKTEAFYGLDDLSRRFDRWGATLTADGATFPFDVKLPPRSAKTLTIEGKVTLVYIGESLSAKVDGLKDKVGERILSEDKLGFRVVLDEVEDSAVQVRVTGNADMVQDIKLVDGEGNDIETWGVSRWKDPRSTRLSLSTSDNIPDDAVLVIIYTDKLEKVIYHFTMQPFELP